MSEFTNLDQALCAAAVAANFSQDSVITVDVDTREITIPEGEKLFGVEDDEKVEIKHIKLNKRFIDGDRDLSQFQFRISYENANGEKNYDIAANLSVSESAIEFDWLLGRSATLYNGTTSFIVCAVSVDASTGNVTNEWNSAIGRGDVKKGIKATVESIGGKDLVAQLQTLISTATWLSNNAIEASSRAQNYADSAAASSATAKVSEDAAATSATNAEESANRVADSMAQIAANKEAIGQLKDGKISKFYTSSQGNTNLPDSDSGRIVDLKLYGKSEQKQYSGKNLAESFESAETLDQYRTSLYIKTELEPSHTYTLSFICKKGYKGYINELLFEQILFTGTGTRQSVICKTKETIDNAQLARRGYIIVKNFTGNMVIPNFSNVMFENGEAMSDDFEPYTGGIPSPNPEYPQEIKSVVKPVVTISDGEDKQQTVTLPYTLNAIPVTSGGNYTDQSGRKWICDEVDLERGVKVQRVKTLVFSDASAFIREQTTNGYRFNTNAGDLRAADAATSDSSAFCSALALGKSGGTWLTANIFTISTGGTGGTKLYIRFENITTLDELQQYLRQTPMTLIAILATPIETPLTADEIAAFKALASYYPVTNVSTTSDQLDGYTVFNYPISLANGWNYVKKQIGDTRDYLYDIDLVTAEAYVNSAYATAIAEMEV